MWRSMNRRASSCPRVTSTAASLTRIRRVDPGDGRSHRTPLAVRNNSRIDDMWLDGVRRLLAGMSEDDAAELLEAAPLLARLGSMSAD